MKKLTLFLISSIFCLQSHAEVGPRGGDVLDLEPPVIDHNPTTGTLKSGDTLLVEARITDNQGVFSATLFYKVSDEKEFHTLAMRLSANDENLFVIEIPNNAIRPPQLEYYIQATDVSGNTVLRGGRLFPLIAKVEGEIPATPETVPMTETASTSKAFSGVKKNNNWIWGIAAGVAVGALYALSNRDSNDGGGGGTQTKGTLNVTAPIPTAPEQQ